MASGYLQYSVDKASSDIILAAPCHQTHEETKQVLRFYSESSITTNSDDCGWKISMCPSSPSCSSQSPASSKETTTGKESPTVNASGLLPLCCGNEFARLSLESNSLRPSLSSMASETLIFIDWDDTLFPTTEIFGRRGLAMEWSECDQLPEVPSDLQEELARWRDALQEHLMTACSLSGLCVVLTSSRKPWVTRCLQRFAPELLPLFSTEAGRPAARVAYATEVRRRKGYVKGAGGCSLRPVRALPLQPLEEMFATHMNETAAKLTVMRREACRFFSRFPCRESGKNIISIGDAEFERMAVQELTFRHMPAAKTWTKAILVPTGPSISELTLRLRISSLLLPVACRLRGDIDLDMRQSADPVQVIGQALNASPEFARSISATSLRSLRHAWSLEEAPPTREEALTCLEEFALALQDHCGIAPTEASR